MSGIRTIRGRRCVVAADHRGYFWERPLEDTITEFREWAATPIHDEIGLPREGPGWADIGEDWHPALDAHTFF